MNYLQDQIDAIGLLERYPDNPQILEQVRERWDILDEVYLEEDKMKELVNRLKRRLIQEFIDQENGIEVSNEGITIHGITGELVESPVSNKSF